MKFETLTYDEQINELTSAARTCLADYGLEGSTLRLLSYYNNAVFSVHWNEKSYTLRLHRPGHKRREWIQSELQWLAYLSRQTKFLVPEPIPTSSGSLLAKVRLASIQEPLPCALFRWVEGQVYPPSTITPDHLRRAGHFLAQLHAAVSSFRPSRDFMRPRLDWTGLFGEDSPYNPGDGARLFTDSQNAIFREVEQRIQETMMMVGQSQEEFGLIHGDFHSKNVVFGHGSVGAIDFDECGWGYFLYDLAPMLLQLTSDIRYPELKEAYLGGYESARTLTAHAIEYLETFIAARHLASIRWQAGNLHNPNIRAHAAETIARRTQHLKQFLATGKLEIKGQT
ncbi:MAG: phosphotransferase [Anaerolineae bacterium]